MAKPCKNSSDLKLINPVVEKHTHAPKSFVDVVFRNKLAHYSDTCVFERHGVRGVLRPSSEENHPVLHVSWSDAVTGLEAGTMTSVKRQAQ